MSEHKRLPWIVKYDKKGRPYAIESSGGESIALLAIAHADVIADDIGLILAAPDLLAAIEVAHKNIGSLTVVSPAIAEAYHALDTAIAKLKETQ